MKNIYLDTETTALKPGQICELTLIEEDADTREFIGASNYFFTVDEMTPGSEKVHGFSIEQLKCLYGGKVFSDYHQDILDRLSGNKLIGHNVSFDINFLIHEFSKCGVTFKPHSKFCTVEYFTEIMRIPRIRNRGGGYKRPTLKELMYYFRISPDRVVDCASEMFNTSGISYHDSRFDTTAVYVITNVWKELCGYGGNWRKRFCTWYTPTR